MTNSVNAPQSLPSEAVNPRPFVMQNVFSVGIPTKISCALLTAILWTCALPEPDVGWLAWGALVPLLIACSGSTLVLAAGLGFVSGVGVAYGTLHWVFEVPAFGIPHFLLGASYLAIYPTVWCLGIAWMIRAGMTLTFPAAALWVMLDYIRAHAGFLGFSWGTLAQTQHQNLPILQIATVAGEHGVTFVVALGSVAIGGMIVQRAWRSAAFAGVIVLLAHAFGAFTLWTEHPTSTIRLAAIQPNTPIGSLVTAEGRRTSFAQLERLTREAAAAQPALIAWPETAIAGNFQANPLLAAELQSLVRDVRTPIVLGVSEVEKFAERDDRGETRRRAYNSAYLLSPDAPLSGPYHKRILMPFGEYTPLERFISWPAWVGGRGYDRAVGNGPQLFVLPDGTSLAILICWESLFSGLSRESVAEGARLLVQLNNPAWFGRSAASQQQNLSSVLRAVENRIPVLLDSNTGPSQLIDAYGRVVASTSHLFAADLVVADIPLGTAGTIYTRTGDVFVFILVCAFALIALRRGVNYRSSPDNGAYFRIGTNVIC